jgi:hypothetical protein
MNSSSATAAVWALDAPSTKRNDRSRLPAQASPTGSVLEGMDAEFSRESGRCHIPVPDDISETEQPFNLRIEFIAS